MKDFVEKVVYRSIKIMTQDDVEKGQVSDAVRKHFLLSDEEHEAYKPHIDHLANACFTTKVYADVGKCKTQYWKYYWEGKECK